MSHHLSNLCHQVNAARVSLVAALTALFALSLVAIGNAVPYDLDPVTDGVTAQIADSLPAILLVGGGLIGVFVIWRIIKRMTSA